MGPKSPLVVRFKPILDALSFWAADLIVSFNTLKSVDFRLGPHPSQEVLQVDGVAIPQRMRKEARHLGVGLTSDLCWNSHVSHLILQSAGPIHLHQKLGYQHRLSSSVIRRFFIAFVRPKLEYCNAVWCGLPYSQAIHLEKLQLKVANAIVRCRDLSHPRRCYVLPNCRPCLGAVGTTACLHCGTL